MLEFEPGQIAFNQKLGTYAYFSRTHYLSDQPVFQKKPNSSMTRYLERNNTLVVERIVAYMES